jgi:ComF family protein
MEEEDSTLKKLSSLLFGGSCFLCRGASRATLCPACDADLPRLAPASEMRLCPRCALVSPGGALCGRCLAEPPGYDATVAALAYAFPADTLVHALKFRGELALAPLLAAILSKRLPGERIELVVPVPLSVERLRSRGYNQSAEIARRLEQRAPLELFLCERSRDTAAQSDLPWSERRRNVRDAFRCTRAIPGATVAVVDDVMTTGATLDEIARVLKRAGAARVVNWIVARTYVEA